MFERHCTSFILGMMKWAYLCVTGQLKIRLTNTINNSVACHPTLLLLLFLLLLLLLLLYFYLFFLHFYIIKFIFIHYVDNILSVIYNNNINNNKAFSKWPTFHIILLNHVLLGFLYWGMVEKRSRGQGLVYFMLFFYTSYCCYTLTTFIIHFCSPLYMYKFYIRPCHVRKNGKSLKFILLLLDILFYSFFIWFFLLLLCCFPWNYHVVVNESIGWVKKAFNFILSFDFRCCSILFIK